MRWMRDSVPAGLRRLARLALLLPVFAWTSAALAASPATIVLGSDYDESTFAGRWYRLIYDEAFRRQGIGLELVPVPSGRLSIELDEGRLDGEVARVRAYADSHPDLVRVEEPIFEVLFSLYATNPALHFTRIEQLSGSGLYAEYRRGVRLCENELKRVLPADRISNVTTTEQGVKKLLAGRTDILCEIDFPVMMALATPELRGATGVRKLLDLGAPTPLYPYVHRRNAALAPLLAAILKQMKAEGLIERYRIEAEREFGLRR